ncbi:hypothetical protein [Methylobacterium sp. Leaf118]|uniref:hypothetical protein n=1 Tax=Methylobacterium sp. Leaf118 TaxID=2876562 RepID=UPI001E28AA0B|nr:hypothetical protein [Methylobacterium sp. Leaf118]
MKRRRSVAARDAAAGLVGTLTDAGVVGAWEWDPATGRFVLDEGAAGLMAGDPRLAGDALLSDRATAGLEAADVARFLGEVRRAAEQDGAVLVELRLSGPPAAALRHPRRILCRGQIHRDGLGRPVRGEGTLVDAAAVGNEARALLGLPEDAAGAAIDEAAGLLIAARQAIDASGNLKLRDLVDVVLLEVGREIASRTRTAPLRH